MAPVQDDGQASSDLIAQLADPRPSIRQRAVEQLGKLRDVTAVAAINDLYRKESDDNIRHAAVVALGDIGSEEAQAAAYQALLTEKEAFIRRAAAQALGRTQSLQLLDNYPKLAKGEGDLRVRYSLAAALAKLPVTKAAPILIDQVTREKPKAGKFRAYLVHMLGEIRATVAIEFLTGLLDDSGEPANIRIAAASSLQNINTREALSTLAVRLGTDSDPIVRRRLATFIANDGKAAVDALVQALVRDSVADVREAAATALQQINAPEEKRQALINSLSTSQRTRGDLDGPDVVRAIGGENSADRQALGDFLIKMAPGQDDRMTGVLADLIIACCGGSVDIAGTRLNIQAGNDEAYRRLRIQVGGELALNPILAQLQINLQSNFTEPIKKLNDRTQADWERTINAAHDGFRLRIWMSGGVFIVGLVIVVVSTYQFLFGNVSGQQLWGTGVTFVGGLGSMLAVVYTGPLREIRKSVNDLGASSAAFIGFIHRVLQASHTYSFFYLKSTITFEQTSQSSDLISKALMDMRTTLDGGETPGKPRAQSK